ncbi:hypothetical protein G5714_021292 [Onychostoma macrolepis]|uniref:Uncharacterized protein n=1 Tax=Onychostoma macrolepis TaxID=369639 RepID=A0A7J6BQV6_9TELE|nr:hypothetical protein G5714_021292 [Onychostoma macrolepis]
MEEHEAFVLEFIVILTTVILYCPLGGAVQVPIRKGINCKGSCVPDACPPSGIRVTVFRGPIDCCDLMKVLYKGRENEKISSAICQKSKDEMEKGHVI